MPLFQYDSQIAETFPAVIGGMIVARGAKNGPSSNAVRELYTKEQQAVLTRIGNGALSDIPSLAAWRGVFRKFNVDPTQYRCAAESLLRRLTKKGDIPSINTLVDLGNLVSIRYALPIAVVDTARLQGGITVHFADGSEPFTPLDITEVEYPVPGEVVFTDEGKNVHARRWCWRQSDQSAARNTTTDMIITVEGHHANARTDVESAVKDVIALLEAHTSATCTFEILDQHNPAMRQ
jgi:DNA/RNA-binding domain of Phe-tRNA-synthetase-like protein